MFKKIMLMLLMLCPMITAADIAPVTPIAVKAEVTDDYLLEVLQGESRIWQFEFSQTGVVKSLTGATGCIMTYQQGNGGTVYSITGQVSNASGGVAQVKWDSGNGTLPGRYRYVAAVTSSNSVLASGKGTLTVSKGIVGDSVDAPVWSAWGVWQAALTASSEAWDASTNALAGITRHNADGTAHSSLFTSIRDTATNALTIAQTAFGWGDHAQAGYLTAETDPVFTGWTTAGFPGVLTTESDPNFTGWIGAGYPGVVTAEADPLAMNAGFLTAETDPVAMNAGFIIGADVPNNEADPVAMAAGFITNHSDSALQFSGPVKIGATEPIVDYGQVLSVCGGYFYAEGFLSVGPAGDVFAYYFPAGDYPVCEAGCYRQSDGYRAPLAINSGGGGVWVGANVEDGSGATLQVNGSIHTASTVAGVHVAADGTGSVADGTYTVGIGPNQNGTITIKDGIITGIQEAN